MVNSEALHEYYGFVTCDHVYNVYERHMGSIDLTTRTYQNFTHHEGTLRGCAILCTEECRAGPYNHIHAGEYWLVDMDHIAGSLNAFCELDDDHKYNITRPAFERTMKDFSRQNIAQKIIQIVESL
jgi:hypothetical protein